MDDSVGRIILYGVNHGHKHLDFGIEVKQIVLFSSTNIFFRKSWLIGV